jgi:hypothetical protein
MHLAADKDSVALTFGAPHKRLDAVQILMQQPFYANCTYARPTAPHACVLVR